MEMGHQIMIHGETKGRGLAVVRQHRQEGLAVSVAGRRRITLSIARREWKRLASLHKECQDLLQTIDALQEGVTVDINKEHARRDASTSINDLGMQAGKLLKRSDAPGIDGDNSEVTSSGVHTHEEDANVLLLFNDRHAGPDDFAMIIPPDQAQMIQNINSLISEVHLQIKAEKEELIQALVTEVSTSTRLKTQRLELLTAQSMASENTIARELTSFLSIRESVTHADEGDESDAVIGDPAGGGKSFRMDNEAVSRWTLKTTAQQTLSQVFPNGSRLE
ncbi:hypothetical protein Cgig2_004641 [Carnegiea gigantea]|uniref:Uncharacterized protein n=1 Tax=Carnegiea gigantea TaxID=171969 RepID=A0A9Q1QCI9_9CARY|nr:hypothetical protein Cgig2_004641 [Carnegiea gigantea]